LFPPVAFVNNIKIALEIAKCPFSTFVSPYHYYALVRIAYYALPKSCFIRILRNNPTKLEFKYHRLKTFMIDEYITKQ